MTAATDQPEALKEKALVIHDKLVDMYGLPDWRPHLDPVSELVSTILSQNTNDTNRDVAFERLRARFPTWEQVRDAPTQDIEDAVRPAGLAPHKAPRIKHALQYITAQRGSLDLNFLKDMPVDEAKDWLTQIKGVGPKTAAIVLLFSLDRPAFPVDTHVHRVSQRLGLIAPGVSAARAHVVLEQLLPQDLYYPFHLNMIRHGRQLCHARKPECPRCALQACCDYYQAQQVT